MRGRKAACPKGYREFKSLPLRHEYLVSEDPSASDKKIHKNRAILGVIKPQSFNSRYFFVMLSVLYG